MDNWLFLSRLVVYTYVLIQILIYEDDADMREGMAQYLSTVSEFSVVGVFSNCDTIEEDVQLLKPNLLLMDIDMPGRGGIEGVRLVKRSHQDIKVLMFTVFDDDKKIFDAICAGADGYLLKKTPPEKIIDALKDVCSGGAPMTPTIARKVLQFFPKSNIISTANEPLTEKEREVLLHLVNGKSYKQVAGDLNVGIETVRTHIKHIYSKLHVRSMSQAVVKAINQKLV
jgi:DNA-binding NarL/FixJ family response regulator